MADKDQDEMLREAARARGFRLVKSRRRKPGGDFGRYGLVGLESGRECLGFGTDGLTATAEEVHAYLRGGEVASWKRSLIGIVDKPPVARAAVAEPASDPPERTRGAPERKQKASASIEQPARQRKAAAPVAPAESESPRPSVEVRSAPSPPPAPVAVREAARRDAAALAKLLGVPAATLAERLAAAARAGEPPLVATRGEGLVGLVAWTIFSTLERGARGRITSLTVAAGERRQGIGSMLLQSLEQRLAEAGVGETELLLDIDFDAPTAFLRRAGYARRTNGYSKKVEG